MAAPLQLLLFPERVVPLIPIRSECNEGCFSGLRYGQFTP